MNKKFTFTIFTFLTSLGLQFNNFSSIAMQQKITTEGVPSIEQIVEAYQQQGIKLFGLFGFMDGTLIFDENGDVLVYNSELKKYMLKNFNDINNEQYTFNLNETNILSIGTKEALDKLYKQFVNCINTEFNSHSFEHEFKKLLASIFFLELQINNADDEQQQKIKEDVEKTGKELQKSCIVF